LFSVIRTVRSSTAFISSSVALMRWPMESRTIQRARLATTSFDSTGSPSWNFRPGRSLKVHTLKSGLTSCPSAICGFGTTLLSIPYSVSQISRLALRTTYCVPATASSDDRLACGTKRSTLLFCASDRRGAAKVPSAAAVPVASKSRRFMDRVFPRYGIAVHCTSRANAPSPAFLWVTVTHRAWQAKPSMTKAARMSL
jgi:hypothetical protein